MRRIKILAIGTLLTLGALAGTALGKEGAITKLDPLPPGGLHAGQAIPVGFTILMDGVEPYKADVAGIVVRDGSGKTISYPATAQGPAGHYVANVNFPAEGVYTWSVTQGTFFPPYDLGAITVLAPVSTPTSTPVSNDPISQAVPLLAGLIALGGTVRLLQLLRSQRRMSVTA